MGVLDILLLVDGSYEGSPQHVSLKGWPSILTMYEFGSLVCALQI